MKRRLITDNGNEAVRILLKKSGLEYGMTDKSRHKRHPAYPSFNSIAYILSSYGVESCLVKTDKGELAQLPMPVVINYDGLFLPVSAVTDNEIHILNESGGVDKEPVSMLDRLWSGTALIFDTENARQNKQSSKDKLKYWFNRMMSLILYISVISAYLYFLLKEQGYLSWEWSAFYSAGIIGLGICILFQIQEFDRGNSLVNRICHSGSDTHGRRDCSSILDSVDSRFAGLFSWADFGLAYFLYLTVLPAIVSTEVYIFIAVILSVPASAYIPYSIIYQWKFARKWCALCLLTQSVLLMNLVTAITVFCFSDHIAALPKIDELLKSALAGVLTVACITTAKQAFKAYKKRETDSINYSRMKHDPEIRDIVLSWQDNVDTRTVAGITSGKKDGHTITMIINPVCSPCMKKLRSFFNIYKNKKHTQLDIIFLTDRQGSRSFQIASYITSCFNLSHKEGLEFLEYYAEHFPVSLGSVPEDFHSEKAEETVMEQNRWCYENRISSTPKTFLDGRELPMIYDIDDIDYMTR